MTEGGLPYLRRRVEGQTWAQADWMPELKALPWDAYTRLRDEHTAAVADLAKAKSAAATEKALTRLFAAVESAVTDLRRRCHLTYGVESFGDGVSEYQEVFGREATRLNDLARREGVGELISDGDLDRWVREKDPPEELIALVRNRILLRDDSESLNAFIRSVLDGGSRLVGVSELPEPVVQVRVEGDELAALQSGAVA
jgi:hypothetical protein